MSESTCWALCYSGADCLSGVGTYLPGTVLLWCRLFKAMSEPTYRALCYRYADCLSSVRTYLLGTVLQWCRLFKQCRNLPAGHCVTVVQTILAVSEPTCWALFYCGADCLSNVRTYLLGTLCNRCADCLSSVGTYLPGTVLQWCRLFKKCPNLPAGTGCLSGVRIYLLGTVLQWCRLL